MLLTIVATAAILIASVTDACLTHSECIGLQMCYKRKCVAAMPAGGMCTTDEHCETRLNQACISGICMVPAVKPPSPNPTKECSRHDECSGQRLCIKFACVAAVWIGDCAKNDKCPRGGVCRYGSCWVPYERARG
ncbi:hypothetical protein M514_04111 [Trichuris suis]|uniref:DUF7107 domain-containing protein n=1 Tax=Trichuris suis TaxID=68888 RepID=A0A085NG10_9BILA|nr:hypothetical protein M513_04111 [Trichuris suis]KFD68406.1 hypothetical protein M514_04111 [Trichuris suis]KHJ47697.1 hypothetical protein D918_01853 [Trichuris suis]